jgi:hypothetical protein
VTFTDILNATAATYDHGTLTADTWFRRAATSTIGSQTCTEFSNVLKVTVNEPPVAPLNAEVDRSCICADDNGNIILTANGGSGTTLYWFAGSCGGTPIGTGSPLVIASPAVTTTYYVRWETEPCDPSACASVMVEIDHTDPVITGCPEEDIDLACNPQTLPTASTVLALLDFEDACIGLADTTVVPGAVVGDCYKSQTWTVTVADSCGNDAQCTITYTWTETQPFEIITPEDSYTLTCDYENQDEIDQAFADWLDDFGVTGGCEPTGSYGTPPPAPLYCVGDTISVTYYVDDTCSTGSATAIFAIAGDRTPPSLSCPAEYNTVCAAPDPYLTWTAFVNGGGSASDNCDIDTLTFEWIMDVSDGQTNPETVTRYYRIEDICGNADTCSQTIILNELQIQAWVYLEGSAIDPAGSQTFSVPMRHTLNDLRVLPGQCYVRQFDGSIRYSPPGQPYNQAPWNYYGTEGSGFDSYGIPAQGSADYPSTAVDWVLVSIRQTLNSQPVCKTAALLLEDGTIDFIEGGFSCCNINPDSSYFLIIEHRNHLIIASPTRLPIQNGIISFDFRVNQSYIPVPNIFGAVGQKPIGQGRYAMYGGNGDQTLIPGGSATDINLDDWGFWYSKNGVIGTYNHADFNMNVDVNYNDRPVWEKNTNNITIVPQY